jgi:hypothetical protein
MVDTRVQLPARRAYSPEGGPGTGFSLKGSVCFITYKCLKLRKIKRKTSNVLVSGLLTPFGPNGEIVKIFSPSEFLEFFDNKYGIS